MLRNFIKVCNTNNTQVFKASYSTKPPEKWDLLSAVCIERRPIITPLPNELEKQFQSLLSDIEHERSYKSDHELRHEMDLKQAELLKKGDTDIDVMQKVTAQDFLDASMEELAKFKPAGRLTKADNANDVKSLNRKLDKHLILLVNQKIGNKSYFLPPQGLRQDGETLKQTAERVLKEHCGTEVKAQIYGNAPSGFYKYKYPKEVQSKTDTAGAKVFIYFARLQKGEIVKKGVDFKWLDRVELEKSLPEAYHKSLSQFLINEL